MKKIFLVLLTIATLSSSCLKETTCTCKFGTTVTFSETSTDKKKVQKDCDSYSAQANGPGATAPTVCSVE